MIVRPCDSSLPRPTARVQVSRGLGWPWLFDAVGRAARKPLSGRVGYSSAVTLWTPGVRWAVVFLAVSAVLFAPATYERPEGSTQAPPPPIEARILAPTVREGIVAALPKLSTRHLQTGDHRSRPESVAFAIASAAAAVLLIGASFAAGFPSRRSGPSLIFFRNPVPRGPPGLQAV